MEAALEPARARGRPREFDTEAALDAAITVFIERGYAATSITDLVVAMNLTAGSIYKAFGDKRGVFVSALERYADTRDARLIKTLDDAVSGRDKAERIVLYYAGNSHSAAGRAGCLIIGTARELAIFDPEIRSRIETAITQRERQIAAAIREGQSDGSLAATLDADATAGALLCLLYGMRVIGKTGRTEHDMLSIAKTALKLLD